MSAALLALSLLAAWVSCQDHWSGLNCPAPRAPDNGLSFIFEEGREVRFACHPGFTLVGNSVSLCSKEDARWDHPVPECLPDTDSTWTTNEDSSPVQADSNQSPVRPLFSWETPEEHPEESEELTDVQGSRRLPLINGLHPKETTRVVSRNSTWHQTGRTSAVSPDDRYSRELDIAEIRYRQQLEASGRANSVLTFPRVDTRRTDRRGRPADSAEDQRRWRIAQARQTPNVLYAGSRSASAYRGDTGDDAVTSESKSSAFTWEQSRIPNPVPSTQRRQQQQVYSADMIELRQRQIAETLRNRMASNLPRGSTSDKAGLVEDARKRQYEEIHRRRSAALEQYRSDIGFGIRSQSDQHSSGPFKNDASKDFESVNKTKGSDTGVKEFQRKDTVDGVQSGSHNREVGEIRRGVTAETQPGINYWDARPVLYGVAHHADDTESTPELFSDDFPEEAEPEISNVRANLEEAVSNQESIVNPDVFVVDNFDDNTIPGSEERIEIEIFRPTDNALNIPELNPNLESSSISPSRGDTGHLYSPNSANLQSRTTENPRRLVQIPNYYPRYLPEPQEPRALFSEEKAAQVEATIRRFLQPGGLVYVQPPTVPTYYARRVHVTTTVPTYLLRPLQTRPSRPTYLPRPTRPILPPPVRSPIHEANNEKAGQTEEAMYQQYLQAEHLRRIMEYERDRLDWERQREWERRNIVRAEEEQRRAAQTSPVEEDALEELRQRPEEEVQGPEEVSDVDLDYANRMAVLSSVDREWLQQLSPDLQARYLEDLLTSRGKEAGETKHAEEFLRRYMDTDNSSFPSVSTRTSASGHVTTIIQSHAPQNVTGSGETNRWDLSCLQSRSGRRLFIRAPKVPYAYVYRYERKRQPPYKPYLMAEYKCRRGYKMADRQNNALYCRRMDWVGQKPICVQRA